MAQHTQLLSSPPQHRLALDTLNCGQQILLVPGQPAQGLISVDRIVADRPFYCAKHRKHGMSLQVIVGPDGQVLWMSSAPAPSRPDQLTKAIGFLQVCEVRSRGLRKRGRRTRPQILQPALPDAELVSYVIPAAEISLIRRSRVVVVSAHPLVRTTDPEPPAGGVFHRP